MIKRVFTDNLMVHRIFTVDSTLNRISAINLIINRFLTSVQTIAALAYLADQGDWGPHLIVAPTSVLINWEVEMLRFAPAFKILTYYGSIKERKIKRQGMQNSFQ